MKYEYKRYHLETGVNEMEKLKEMGEQGWLLVQIVISDSANRYYYFSRRIDQEMIDEY